MRRPTSKAAVALMALAVALPAGPALADYVIGPDGSVQLADEAPVAAPIAVEPAPVAAPAAPAPIEAPVVADAPLADLLPEGFGKMAPVADAPLTDEMLEDASAPDGYALEPLEAMPMVAEPVAAPMPVVEAAPVAVLEPAPAPMIVAPAPVQAEPVYTQTYTPPAPMQAAPAPVQAAPAITVLEALPVEAVPLQAMPVAQPALLSAPTPLSTVEALPMAVGTGSIMAAEPSRHARIQHGHEGVNAQSTELYVAKATILDLPSDAAEVAVSDPSAVRAVLRTARQIVLIGLKVGTTNIVVFDEGNERILSLDVTVRYDLEPLKAALKRHFPETHVGIDTVLGEVILSGTPTGPGEAEQIRSMVRRYLYSAMLGAGANVSPDSVTFVDRLASAADDQVLLKVRVAEMRRSVVKQFGVDWSVASSVAASTLAGPTLVDDFARSISSFGVNGGQLGGLSANIAGSIGSTDFGALVKAFERHNVMRTLAEPTLTAVTGETASFLAGGQFPFPTSIDDGDIGYEFRDFGVALEFTPVVVGEGRISLRIATEISELSSEGALSTPLITIPGVSVRRAETTVELPSGGTMSIAGMMLQRDRASHQGLPGIKNVPVVGQLFSSSDYLKEETELVILVTPYIVKPAQERDFRLPTDGFAPASDIDFYLLGRLHKIYGTGDQDIAAARQALNAPLGFIIE